MVALLAFFVTVIHVVHVHMYIRNSLFCHNSCRIDARTANDTPLDSVSRELAFESIFNCLCLVVVGDLISLCPTNSECIT